MSDLFTNIAPVANLYKKASIKSEVVSQILFGERFTILSRSGKWLKIRIIEDGYKGYIKKNSYYSNIKPTHKVSSLRAKVYKFPNLIKKTSELTFGSKIKILEKKSKFFKFHKGWINKNDVKPIYYRENNPFRKISIFEPISGRFLLSNSDLFIRPSDLNPISTITSLSLIPITFAEII